MHGRHGIRRLAGAILGGVFVGAAGSAQTTQRVSVSTTWTEGHLPSTSASVSGDGRIVAFQSDASDLVVGDTNGCTDVFVRNRAQRTTVRVSVGTGGAEGDAASRE